MLEETCEIVGAAEDRLVHVEGLCHAGDNICLDREIGEVACLEKTSEESARHLRSHGMQWISLPSQMRLDLFTALRTS